MHLFANRFQMYRVSTLQQPSDCWVYQETGMEHLSGNTHPINGKVVMRKKDEPSIPWRYDSGHQNTENKRFGAEAFIPICGVDHYEKQLLWMEIIFRDPTRWVGLT